MPRTYFSSPSPQCRSISLMPLYTHKKTTSILPQPAPVWCRKDAPSLLHSSTHHHRRRRLPGSLIHCKENSWNRSLNSELHPDNLPVLLKFFCFPVFLSHLVTPHASTETVSLMPWTSVSASAVNSPLVQSLWFLFMSLLFLWFLLDTHTRTHTDVNNLHRCWMVRLHDKLFDSHHQASLSVTTKELNLLLTNWNDRG